MTPDSDNSALSPVVPAGEETGARRGPWKRVFQGLIASPTAMISAGLLMLIVVATLLAPVYAKHVAGTDPFRSGLSAKIKIDGKPTPVMQQSTEGLGLGVTPIGPTWGPQYMLGADGQGRDVAARMLYGGRNSLLIAGASTLICLFCAAIIGIAAGYSGGMVDGVLSNLIDMIWAFPVYLLAISLSIVMIGKSFALGPFEISSGSLIVPILIIGLVYVPYVARPIRGRVMAINQSEFVMAARGLGIRRWKILLRHILPNVSTTLIVFAPMLMALNIVTESSLSFLSVGVQPPNASWGTILQDGQTLLYSRPWVSLAPGLAIMVTVLLLNLFGDVLRDVLDPKSARGR
ncbi:ABC transporter permease [Pseudogemmobacter blasticus]|uniref:Peptide ABC transporter permease n=1 Tax=Fuscovulum blasticum DSM 2131 TaxID=1188250 RepID=A0A2T4J960_FUSBL|nr:ABC transporter permease [Fuscovulum blasticum]AWD22355.1 peptide ABC transporter permease [Fuscovulum blasticum]PTE14450.1 peptide ABC transporter permease [Fuscovulum blasticum DSM 2131]